MNSSSASKWSMVCAGLAGLAAAGAWWWFHSPEGSTRADAAARPAAGGQPPVAAGAEDWFEDVTQAAGIQFVHQFADTKIANIIESNGAGGAVLDFDDDGWYDLFLVNSGVLEGVTHAAPGTVREPNRLYRNRGNGTFEDVTLKAGVGGSGYGVAAAAADYDNDGFTDLLVVNVGRNALYRNRGDGTFEDVTRKAGVDHEGTGIGAVFFDADRDGHLDLFVANYLKFDPTYKLHYNPDAYPGPLAYQPEMNRFYRNNGNGTFADVSAGAGVRLEGHRAMAAVAFDFDEDGDEDLYVSNDATPNVLLVNDGRGQFQDQGIKLGVAFNAVGEAAGSMAAAVGDCNRDGLFDLLVTRLGYGSLYMGTRQRFFDDRMMVSGLGALTAQFVGWGGSFFDFDCDGDLDIFIANGDAHYLVGWESLLLENRGDGSFADAADKGGAFFKTKYNGRGSAVFDYDNDGRLDIIVTGLADRPMLLRNRGRTTNAWLTLDVRGRRANRDGFGTKVKVVAGDSVLQDECRCTVGFLMQGDRRLHFGLGARTMADRVEIRWPSGTTQVLTNVPANQILKVVEPGGDT